MATTHLNSTAATHATFPAKLAPTPHPATFLHYLHQVMDNRVEVAQQAMYNRAEMAQQAMFNRVGMAKQFMFNRVEIAKQAMVYLLGA
jgi:hypothetical protein